MSLHRFCYWSTMDVTTWIDIIPSLSLFYYIRRYTKCAWYYSLERVRAIMVSTFICLAFQFRPFTTKLLRWMFKFQKCTNSSNKSCIFHFLRGCSRSYRTTLKVGQTCSKTAPTIIHPAKTCARRNSAVSRFTKAPAIGVPANAPKEEIPHIMPRRVPKNVESGQKTGCATMDVGAVTKTPLRAPQ